MLFRSFKRWQNRAVDGKVLMARTAAFETPDDRTFVFKLKQPYGMMLETLGGAANTLFVMREKDAATDAFQEVKDSVGSGPFKFIREAWVPGAMVAFAKNTDYVPRSDPPDGQAGGKVVKLDRVEYKVIPDSATSIASLNQGEVDVVDQPPLDLDHVVVTSVARDDLADGGIAGSKVDLSTVTTALGNKQDADADLTDLADGGIAGSKVDLSTVTTAITNHANLTGSSAHGATSANTASQIVDRKSTRLNSSH